MTRIWEFSAGIIAATFVNKFSISPKIRMRLPLVSISGLIILLYLPFNINELATMLLSVFLTATLASLNHQKNNLASTALVWVGDRSYSIYLMHFPIVYLCKYSPLSELGPKFLHYVLLLAGLPISMLAGSVLYNLVERRNQERKILPSRIFLLKHFSPAIAAISILICANNNLFIWNVAHEIPTYGGFPPKSCEKAWQVNQLCKVGDKNSESSVMLLGDSHAGHLANSLIQSVDGLNLRGYIWRDVSCIKTSMTLNSVGCRAIKAELNNALDELNPSVVLVSFHITNQVNLNLMLKFIEELRDAQYSVISIGQTPSFPDSEKYFESPLLFFKSPLPRKNLPSNEMDVSGRQANLEWEKDLRAIGVTVLPTSDIFCKDNYCTRFANNEWLYRDKNHLSLEGAQLLVPRLDQFLEDQLRFDSSSTP